MINELLSDKCRDSKNFEEKLGKTNKSLLLFPKYWKL